jgi:hypothetical protein
VSTPLFTVCSKCLEWGTEFQVALHGRKISLATFHDAQTMAARLKEYVANPKGIRQILNSVAFDPPDIPIFELLTCPTCGAVHERKRLDYWVVEVGRP